MKYFLKTQTPVIELPITAKDAAGEKERLTVGFKRLPAKEAKKVTDAEAKYYAELADKYQTLLTPEKEAQEEPNFEEKMEKSLEAFNSGMEEEATQRLDKKVAEYVLYLKKVDLLYLPEGKADEPENYKTMRVCDDTRTAPNNADLWGDSSNCLQFLLSMYLESSPWRLAFNQGISQALGNLSEAEEQKGKN